MFFQVMVIDFHFPSESTFEHVPRATIVNLLGPAANLEAAALSKQAQDAAKFGEEVRSGPQGLLKIE